jgi:hypothetical protein
MMRAIAVGILVLAVLSSLLRADEVPSPVPAQAPSEGSSAPKGEGERVQPKGDREFVPLSALPSNLASFPTASRPTTAVTSPPASQDAGEQGVARYHSPVPLQDVGDPGVATYHSPVLLPVDAFVNPLANIYFADPYGLGGNWRYLGPDYLDPTKSPREPDSLAFRFGWWNVWSRGSPRKTGEYQDLESAPFWDVDGLRTDGTRTLNFFATGLDDKDTQTEVQFYGPLFRADFGYQQFPHELNHRPVTNFQSNPQVLGGQDLNVGEDYAIRVDEFKGEVSTNLTENIKLRVQAWGMRKFGDRQAEAATHCFLAQGGTSRTCHILNQSQHIDWVTSEVTPRLEARFGPVTIEYSRLMRQFTQSDQMVTRTYNGAPPILMGEFPYAVVPENITQMDQLRLGVDLAAHTRFYGFGYIGNTDDQLRHVRRDYSGYDVRLTDSTIHGLSLTTYARGYHQTGMLPSTLLPEETMGLTDQQIQAEIRNPIEYERTTGGFRDSWRPALFEPLCRLTFTGGYEYDDLRRRYAVFQQGDAFNRINANIELDEPSTVTQTVHAGAEQVWGGGVDTYERYRVEFVKNPLYGFSETSAVINTALPKRRNIIDVGGSWFPRANFGILAEQEVDLGWHFADISAVPGNVIHFNESSYSTVLTLWYAPTKKLSLTASGAILSNWIEQNITLGDDFVMPGMPNLTPPVTRPWNYAGTANILSFRANYRLYDDLRLSAGYEYSRGSDSFSNRSFTDLWPDLPQYSDVLVVTHRVTAGIDWRPTELLTVYFRYVYFDYDDKLPGLSRGISNMFLAGLSMIF